ncbi:hypothetical protein PILCRDRAFT_826136 [Piloderma croceum F 1598]|uniref:Extracellular membrane protein CFEM domain-containing protein n=1 Tax=Piloderma croceum (strain F 1598) TaxID=765440 RepID=A0A0C3FAH0_PILCF|nr:hypothetical protein PILCRDRAFT_826136 [Piloderma croceum F 1598]
MFFPLAFLSVLVIAGEASSSSVLSHSLHARYINPNEFPTQCQSTCLPIVNALNTCTSTTCICTKGNSNNIESCGDCVLQVDSLPTEIAEVQYIFDYFFGYCVGAGIAITPPSISVSGPSAAITVAASASSATAGGVAVTVTAAHSASSAGAGAASSTENPLLKNGVAGRMEITMTVLAGAGFIPTVLLHFL